jgi:hypothetical protein
MQNGQNFNEVAPDAVGYQVRGLIDDQLARSCPPTATPALREARESFDCRKDSFNLPLGGGRRFARNVLAARQDRATLVRSRLLAAFRGR